ncbi:hypothetical protein KFK09_024558 [Dendrobium nobile]|uniref:TMEM205-like domain-containing protein n=1 Tax=Dendrobium nobile TaxID=94219 RepID=A0A8T3AEE4_DENNO|nr:hypothetical protein KFK09_024558 [Dendrobium nobile]
MCPTRVTSSSGKITSDNLHLFASALLEQLYCPSPVRSNYSATFSLFLSKMMNLLCLSLLISSFATAGFPSSPPPPPPPYPVPPIRKGHRIFVAEEEIFSFGEFEISAKALSEKAKNAGEEVTANISATTRKSVHRAEAMLVKFKENITAIMRRARDLWPDVAVHVLHEATRAARSAAAVAHLLGFTFAFGTCVWVTFPSSHVLASALPRKLFGIVQSRIYSVYFGVVALGVGVAVTTADKAQRYNLLAVLAMVIVNMLYLEPRATKAMFERVKLEKEDAKGRDIAENGVEPAVMGPRPTPIFRGFPRRISEDGQRGEEFSILGHPMNLMRQREDSSSLRSFSYLSPSKRALIEPDLETRTATVPSWLNNPLHVAGPAVHEMSEKESGVVAAEVRSSRLKSSSLSTLVYVFARVGFSYVVSLKEYTEEDVLFVYRIFVPWKNCSVHVNMLAANIK